MDDAALAVTLKPDARTGTLTVSDNGIGMNRDELIENLGTIARSGTEAFMTRMAAEEEDGAEARGAAGLIGQFGVGFYSAFMVAKRVEVSSRRAGEAEGWRWESKGTGSFSVSSDAGRVARHPHRPASAQGGEGVSGA